MSPSPKVKITWAEPPPANHSGGRTIPSKWQPIAEQIKKRPGDWALVAEQGPVSVGTWFRKQGFVVRLRNTVKPTPTTQRCDTYVMWPTGK